MPPVAHTLFSLILFLGLVALKLRCDRRNRIAPASGAGVEKSPGGSK